jgi:hypothetical protein
MMTRRHSGWKSTSDLAGVLALILISSSLGCQWHGMYGPGGCGTCTAPMVEVGCDSCGTACDGSCGPSGGQFPGTCGTCVSGGCGGFSGLMLPLLSNHLACGSGCGDVYWGEWIFDPPECCDACHEAGCWAGSECDGSYCAYGPGCGHGLLGGPIAVIRGTYLGVTHLVQGTFSVLSCGYNSAMYGAGYGHVYGYGPGNACGCDECAGDSGVPACSSCGTSSCDGGCAQIGSRATPTLASRPRGSGVASSHGYSTVVAHSQTAKPPHRLVTKRLRR